jgi:DNA end-binding protein Ku
MAERANWKGTLKLSLVTCPIQLFTATQSQKVSFNMLNPKTGNRLKQQLVDAATGEKVERMDTVRGFAVEKDTYVTINIDAFVKRSEIDERYIERPYYIVPDDDGDAEAYAVIREALRKKGMVAIGQVILQRREHLIAIEPCKNGMVGLLLRYPNEIRATARYFSEIEDVKVDPEAVDLATVIIDRKAAKFDPDQFHDRYEESLRELLEEKKRGVKITASSQPAGAGRVIDLMSALRKSVSADRRSPTENRTQRRRTTKKASPRSQRRRA